jgi:hypothetical protein
MNTKGLLMNEIEVAVIPFPFSDQLKNRVPSSLTAERGRSA